ncbi:MAG: 3-phosphoserine/phosphohydroxythreonine transaminase [Flavobacteriales bacterium]|nr:3-phosphoserine/phosphohydroxythreonine transaminase [Flavobacteriales bacterium]
MLTKIHNFSAGPGILPAEVMKKASEACINFKNSGLSLLEISHRSKDYVEVMDEARSIIKQLLELGNDYEVLYLGGGASLQFGMVPYNLLSDSGYAAYVNTGTWASKAIQEAQKIGRVSVIASSEDKNFSYIPKKYTIPSDADYLHITSNNTIYGTQIKEFPKSNIPVVCDMSSDIFSRKVDANQFALIYAGAQKNMGPAGVTLVVIRKDMVGRTTRKKLSMLDYAVHIKGESMYNTPPVFPVYVVLETLKWLQANGGIAWIEKMNNAKAELLYNEIDTNPLFYGTAAKEDRSYMNVCFLLHKPELETIFEKTTKEAGISGIKGHRSVGGYRASIYNAMPIESVKVLTEIMKEFAIKHG